MHTLLAARFSAATVADEHFLSFLCNPLLAALNETKLYGKDAEAEEEEEKAAPRLSGEIISELLAEFLAHCLAKLEPSHQSAFLRTLVTAACSRSWAPVPLTWVSFSLVSLGKTVGHLNIQLSCSEVSCVRSLVETGMQYQEPLLRAAAQTNLCSFVLDTTTAEDCSYEELASFMFVFWSKKVLICDKTQEGLNPNGITLWDKASQYVSRIFGGDIEKVLVQAKTILDEVRKMRTTPTKIIETTITKMCIMIILFLSHHDFESKLVAKLQDDLLFKCDSDRAYDGDRFQFNDEEWRRPEYFAMRGLLKVVVFPERRPGRHFLTFQSKQETERFKILGIQNNAEQVFKSVVCDTINRLQTLLESKEDVENIFRVEMYLDLLREFIQANKENISSLMIMTAGSFLKILEFQKTTKVQKVIVMKVFHFCTEHHLVTSLTQFLVEKLEKELAGSENLLTPLLSEDERENDIQNRDEQKIWGKLSGQYLSSQLVLINFLLSNNVVSHLIRRKEDILSCVSEAMETGGKECLEECLNLALCLNVPCTEFLQLSKRYIFEFRKNEIFWRSLSLFIKLSMANIKFSILQQAATERNASGDPDDVIVPIFLDLIGESENVNGIFPLLMTEISAWFEEYPHPEYLLALLPVLARALTHGSVYRRDQRLVTETNEYIFNLGGGFEANWVEGSDHMMEAGVRVHGLKCVLIALARADPGTASTLVARLLSELQRVNAEVTGKRTRHFENSGIHRVRHRLYQVYLLLAPLLQLDQATEVVEQLVEVALGHGEQVSCDWWRPGHVTPVLTSDWCRRVCGPAWSGCWWWCWGRTPGWWPGCGPRWRPRARPSRAPRPASSPCSPGTSSPPRPTRSSWSEDCGRSRPGPWRRTSTRGWWRSSASGGCGRRWRPRPGSSRPAICRCTTASPAA